MHSLHSLSSTDIFSSFQLEHTGTTITQTLSGLWLDSKVKKEKIGLLSIFSEIEPRLQWLLNGFLFVNLLHLIAIWGLGYLNEKKHKQQEVTRPEGDDYDYDNDEGRRGTSPSSRRSVSPDLLRSRSPTRDRTTLAARDRDHTTSPLLRPRDISSVYQTYGTHGKQTQDSTTRQSPITHAEERRGMLFALLSATIVFFAWVLFFITSFIKIRSRREREGHGLIF